MSFDVLEYPLTDGTTREVPNVSQLPAALNGEGLLLEGWASTPTLDRQGDIVNPKGLEKSVARFLETNPILLWSHKLSLPPIGRVLSARVDPVKGLWVQAIIPKPATEGLRQEIYSAVKDGLLRGFSLGAKWVRRTLGNGMNEVTSGDVYELSLCSSPVGMDTVVSNVEATEAKAMADGLWLPVGIGALEQANLIHDHYCRKSLSAKLERAAVQLDVVELAVASRQLRGPVAF